MAHVRRHATCEYQEDVGDKRGALSRPSRLGASEKAPSELPTTRRSQLRRAKHSVNPNPPQKRLTKDAVKPRLTSVFWIGWKHGGWFPSSCVPCMIQHGVVVPSTKRPTHQTPRSCGTRQAWMEEWKLARATPEASTKWKPNGKVQHGMVWSNDAHSSTREVFGQAVPSCLRRGGL